MQDKFETCQGLRSWATLRSWNLWWRNLSIPVPTSREHLEFGSNCVATEQHILILLLLQWVFVWIFRWTSKVLKYYIAIRGHEAPPKDTTLMQYVLFWVVARFNIYLVLRCPRMRFFLYFLGFLHYSALLHLPPLRFHCADGCWERTQNEIFDLLDFHNFYTTKPLYG